MDVCAWRAVAAAARGGGRGDGRGGGATAVGDGHAISA